ncbi:MAG: integrase arm-type DNA-binding domain-containing protein, partial [Xanthomonadaceae bacterium]|nr:integrase arm-type DNA-binding domain-containing protein [Xanthomonadaceae bacterium]
MPLTNITIRKAKPIDKTQRLFDGGGMYLEISPAGGKWWRLKYRFDGKEKRLSLGTYPDTSLSDARAARDDARKLLVSGIDPSAHRKASKAAGVERVGNSFEVIAREWFAKQSATWAKGHADKVMLRLENDIFPLLGKQPVAEINAKEALAMVNRVVDRGAVESAHRCLQYCNQVFRYAIASGRAERNPTADLRGALPPVKSGHHASITDPHAIGELLRAIDGYSGGLVVRSALRLSPLLFVRPGELRHMEWVEIDFDNAQWNIPEEKMKMRAPHIVPLSSQAMAILRDLHPLTGHGRYAFPS